MGKERLDCHSAQARHGSQSGTPQQHSGDPDTERLGNHGCRTGAHHRQVVGRARHGLAGERAPGVLAMGRHHHHAIHANGRHPRAIHH
eukprot:14167834-Heterocapsa_arctica.AAC.1